jgi:hypothetical protein
MQKSFFILLLTFFFSGAAFACINTYQFKMFPVGVHNNEVITVDVKVNRTSQYEGKNWHGLKTGGGELDEMWILTAFVSIYDKKQKLISKTPLDSSYSLGSSYTDTLQRLYSKGFNSILKQFPSLELFAPYYISFCDFQKQCDRISIVNDSTAKNDYMIYRGQRYSLDIVHDTAYYGFARSPYYIDNTLPMHISSVRIYRSKSMELVIAHLETGHELSMGWITSDPKKKPQEEYDTVILAKEHKPGFVFNDIKKATYSEPLLHHGYGYDVFIVK